MTLKLRSRLASQAFRAGSVGMRVGGHSVRCVSHQHQHATASHTSAGVRAVLRVGRSGIRVALSVYRGGVGHEALLGGLQAGAVQAGDLFQAVEGTAGADTLDQASAPAGAAVVGFDALQQAVSAIGGGGRAKA